jgi:hypothetical protein
VSAAGRTRTSGSGEGAAAAGTTGARTWAGAPAGVSAPETRGRCGGRGTFVCTGGFAFVRAGRRTLRGGPAAGVLTRGTAREPEIGDRATVIAGAPAGTRVAGCLSTAGAGSACDRFSATGGCAGEPTAVFGAWAGVGIGAAGARRSGKRVSGST